jgi:hypothetical protein
MTCREGRGRAMVLYMHSRLTHNDTTFFLTFLRNVEYPFYFAAVTHLPTLLNQRTCYALACLEHKAVSLADIALIRVEILCCLARGLNPSPPTFRAITLLRKPRSLFTSYLEKTLRRVRFHVLTAATMKVTAFWDVEPCSLFEVDRRFRGAYCFHQQGDCSEDGLPRKLSSSSPQTVQLPLLKFQEMFINLCQSSLNLLNHKLSLYR